MIFGQVNARGDVFVSNNSLSSLLPTSGEGFLVQTTAGQSVAENGAIIWHSDSSFGCFNDGGWWNSGTPNQAILPQAVEPIEFYLSTVSVAMAAESCGLFTVNSPLLLDLDVGIYPAVSTLILHAGQILRVLDSHDDTQRTVKVTFGTEYMGPFTVNSGSSWSIVRVR